MRPPGPRRGRMDLAIESTDLVKRYPHSKKGQFALDHVSLAIPRAGVYGLIGRNGAGKTTFVRICGTQLEATSGSVRVLGYDALHDPRPVRERIASVPQESRPLYFLTVDELIFLYLRMRGMERTDARRRTNAVLEELQLTPVRRTIVNRLSGGMRRRAMVAMVLASDAEVLFLDEPTTGLDPLARREVWAAIRRASREKRTVLLTTHYLDEAEELSARLALLENGRVVLEGTPAELRARSSYPYRVTLDRVLPRASLDGYGSVSDIEGGYLVFAREKEARELSMVALSQGARVSMGPVSLEDIFLQVVGRPLTTDDETEKAEADA
jgi:ABC-2 type transport system ATP-binding protein